MKYFYTLILSILFCQPWIGDSATYTGRNAADAGVYLDNAQAKRGFGFRNPGHARNHVSSIDPPSVEEFSRHQDKSGFDNRDIQNEIAHRALIHPKVIAAMAILNQYNDKDMTAPKYKRQAIHLTSADLDLPDPTLTGGNWKNGKRINSMKINGAVIVLQHYSGKQTDRSAPVHIETLYPKLIK